jgi:hypothetical protein
MVRDFDSTHIIIEGKPNKRITTLIGPDDNMPATGQRFIAQGRLA